MSRVWYITGCSTGIGRMLAERALAAGDRVAATARRVETLTDLGGDCADRILRLAVDVREPAQIQAAVATTLEQFGGIDVLVNNAGYGYFSIQEEADLDAVRAMFETNVFGLIAQTQAVLPTLRENRAGTIVNISSMAGRIGTPRGGFYQASKWAVEALSESLTQEVAGFGVRVVVIEPGRYETRFVDNAQRGGREEDPASPYAAERARWSEAVGQLYPDNQDPTEVVDAIWSAVDDQRPFVRVTVGRDANQVVDTRRELGGDGLVEWLREKLNP